MFKFIALGKCTLCAIPTPRPLMSVKNRGTVATKLKDYIIQCYDKQTGVKEVTKKRRLLLRVSQKHISAIKSLLEKFDIDTSQLKHDKKILVESLFTIERRILLLQEMGVSTITSSLIVNFIKGMYLPVNMFKANFAIGADVNLAKNMFSFIENPNINYEDVSNLNENMSMKQYYTNCFVHYLKNELDLTEAQAKRISYKRYSPVLYNSFSLLQRTLKIARDLQFKNTTLMRNRWIFCLHPDHAIAVQNIVDVELKLPQKVLLKYPRLLNYDLVDLNTLVAYFRHYGITPQMIMSCHEIFHLSSTEFKRRVDNILINPFTLVYQKHPRFLLLVRDYTTILPRIRYLEEKNLKFATIHSLTTFHNYLEQLISTKRLNKLSLVCFLQSQFGDEDTKELLRVIQKHPTYTFAPLVQMYETLVYLRELYPKKTIYKHIYAILYSKLDLHAAYELIMMDPYLNKFQPDHLLALCVYKVEEKSHFNGDGVLEPEKYAESVKEEMTNQDNTIEADSKEE